MTSANLIYTDEKSTSTSVVGVYARCLGSVVGVRAVAKNVVFRSVRTNHSRIADSLNVEITRSLKIARRFSAFGRKNHTL